jgi:predicted enzyme related to lactoylglutathione lyase
MAHKVPRVADGKKPAIGRIGWIQIDCPDPERLAAFWTQVLGVEIEGRLGTPPQFVNLERQFRDAPYISFQRVPEPKVGKNRMHLDLVVDDVEEATSRIVSLGGRRRRPEGDFNEYGYSWRTMADPEGNEFCLIYEP